MARGDETEIRAYDGEVESLTSATSAGIGIRVVVDHKLGFAWAGSLDESVLGRRWTRPGTTPAFATPDEHVQLAVARRGPGSRRRPVGRRAGLGADLGQGRARPRPRSPGPRRRPPDPTGRRRPTTATRAVEMALASTTGIRSSNRKTKGFRLGGGHRRRGRGQPDRRRVHVGRGFEGLDRDKATTDAVERAVRMLGATKGPSGRSMVVFDRRVAVHPSRRWSPAPCPARRWPRAARSSPAGSASR